MSQAEQTMLAALIAAAVKNRPSKNLTVEQAVEEIVRAKLAIEQLTRAISNQRVWTKTYHLHAQRNACGMPTTVEVSGERYYWSPEEDGAVKSTRN